MGSEHTRQEEAPATVPRLAILLVEDDPGIVSALLQVLRLADSRSVRLLLVRRWRQDAGRANPNACAADLVGLAGGKAWRKAS